jgi:small-conductance mechanosensitive channel
MLNFGALQFEWWNVWLERVLRASVYLLGAAILTALVVWLVKRFVRYLTQLIRERRDADVIELEKQTATIAALVRRVALIVLWALALTLALRELGLNVEPLLAGAGVAGIAIGFAAQSLLKDWISGFMLITEGQIRINDVLKIGDVSGSVEKITLRTLSLRAYDGTLHVISNGTITRFSNLTLMFSYAVFEIPADYADPPERMMELMRRVDGELRRDPVLGAVILAPLEMAGVDRLAPEGVVVKARIKTVPSKQWDVTRAFLRRLKELCDAEGVALATVPRSLNLYRQTPKEGA